MSDRTENLRKKNRIDIDSRKSDLSGMAGFFETILRRFRTGTFLFALSLVYVMAIAVMGISAAPGIYAAEKMIELAHGWNPILHYPAIGIAIVCAFYIYGFTLIFVTPFFNLLFRKWVREFRGSYFSLHTVPWYIHNALTYIVRYTFLEFVTPTPLNILFYRMMGMKIGKGSHINTTNISDPCLIELGEKVTIGGSAHLMAHYGQGGFLVIGRVKIGKSVTIGLKATVMGDVHIEDGAMVGPHEAILPKTRIAAGRKPAKKG